MSLKRITIEFFTLAVIVTTSFFFGVRHGILKENRKISEIAEKKIHEVNMECRNKLMMYFNKTGE
jgi:hypothetical protein